MTSSNQTTLRISQCGNLKQVHLEAEPLPGSFALDWRPANFIYCRESFAKIFTDNVAGLFFSHKAGIGLSVSCFLQKTEKILGLSDPSLCSETNFPFVLWIEPSLFWMTCEMRRSLLTILLRAAMIYDRVADNYEEALFSNELVIPTKRAVRRFLFGFTEYRGPSLQSSESIQARGWKSTFQHKDELEIRKMLVSSSSGNYFRAEPSLRSLCF